jgi:hypothetical protein
MPLPAALIPAVSALKGLTGMGVAKATAGMGASKAAASMGAFMKGASARRMAGEALGKVGSSLKNAGSVAKGAANMSEGANQLERIKRGLTSVDGFKKNLGIPMTADDLKFAIAPDLLFGGMAAVTTEGDIVDKTLAGVGSAAGGIVGGLGLRGALGPKSGLGVMGSEMVGGMLGDQVGYGVANNLIAAKNGGQTPAEQRMMSEQQQYEAQLRSQMYDQFMAENGLG